MSQFSLHVRDLLAHGELPGDWQRTLLDVCRMHARDVSLDGTSVTSRQTVGETRRYRVVTGDVIRDHARWLDDLYRGPLCEWAARATGRELFPANDLKSAVNLNVLHGRGTDYESHVDSNPVTGLLFVTSHEHDGALVFEPSEGLRISVAPRAGTFVAFDARAAPHWVNPLTVSDLRVSAPMNYYESPKHQERPADLDAYIYGS